MARVLYYPYGETRYTEGTLQTDYQYTGQRNEAGLGLMDYGTRYYDAYLGRFISPDTIVPDSEDPQSWNRYAYVRNNPLLYIDSDGHFPRPAKHDGGWSPGSAPPREEKPRRAVRGTYQTGGPCLPDSLVVPEPEPPPGIMPVSGYELPYDPERINSDLEVLKDNNCYSYAVDDLSGPPARTQPGGMAGYEASPTVEGASRGVIIDNHMPVAPDEPCPPGTYKMMLFVDPGWDFHLYRQNQSGFWSHKPGFSGEVTNVDASYEHIRDPRLANRDYGFLNYTEYSGAYCVVAYHYKTYSGYDYEAATAHRPAVR